MDCLRIVTRHLLTLFLYWALPPCNTSLLSLRSTTFWSTLSRGKVLQEVLKLSRLPKKQEWPWKHGVPCLTDVYHCAVSYFGTRGLKWEEGQGCGNPKSLLVLSSLTYHDNDHFLLSFFFLFHTLKVSESCLLVDLSLLTWSLLAQKGILWSESSRFSSCCVTWNLEEFSKPLSTHTLNFKFSTF